MALRPCKVLIVGGGIAGLALALMLERNAVDYLLLEAYPKIVTDVGAGICMMPNGLRVLDQLSCYEDLLRHTQNPVSSISFRDLGGELLGSLDGSLFNERYALDLPIAIGMFDLCFKIDMVIMLCGWTARRCSRLFTAISQTNRSC